MHIPIIARLKLPIQFSRVRRIHEFQFTKRSSLVGGVRWFNYCEKDYFIALEFHPIYSIFPELRSLPSAFFFFFSYLPLFPPNPSATSSLNGAFF